MTKKHILIVEDDEDIQQLVSFNLIKNGFLVSCAENSAEAYEVLERDVIHCVLLDIMLPGENGLSICRTLRKQATNKFLPIIMMTAKCDDDEIIEGLEAGADDYITKPFSPRVLTARVQAALRRRVLAEQATEKDDGSGTIPLHNLLIDLHKHRVFVDGRETSLTSTEFSILVILAKRPGWVLSRQQIIDAIRGHNYMVTPRMIDVQIFSLRKKLKTGGQYIETVRGIGYRLKEPTCG